MVLEMETLFVQSSTGPWWLGCVGKACGPQVEGAGRDDGDHLKADTMTSYSARSSGRTNPLYFSILVTPGHRPEPAQLTAEDGVVVLGPLLWWAMVHHEMFCRVYRSPWTDRRPPMPIRRLPTVGVREDPKIVRSDGERFGALIGEQLRRFL